MLAKTKTCAVVGLDGHVVEVEVDASPGLPAFNIVGLPAAAVQESRERVRAAIRNSGAEFPMRRITVSLAPADLKKTGPSYDLPIAVGILMSSGQLPENVKDAILLGELALNGALRSTRGILPMVAVGKQRGYKQVFVPFSNGRAASLVDGMSVLPAVGLEEVIAHIRADEQIDPYDEYIELDDQPSDDGRSPNLADVRGQEHAKRALGGHNLLMSGPPGSGKTLLARCLLSIIPPMTPEQSLEVTKIYSVAGLLPEGSPLITRRPFRSPHYTISNTGLVGGGQTPRPEEITLSHRGVLFLDELPEFGSATLEVFRQPIKDKMVTISRAQWNDYLPSKFHDGFCDEPLPMRVLRQFTETMLVLAERCCPLPAQDLRADARPHGHFRGGAAS